MMSEANPNNTQEPQRDTLTQTLLELVRALKNVAVAIGVLLEPIIISIAKGLTRLAVMTEDWLQRSPRPNSPEEGQHERQPTNQVDVPFGQPVETAEPAPMSGAFSSSSIRSNAFENRTSRHTSANEPTSHQSAQASPSAVFQSQNRGSQYARRRKRGNPAAGIVVTAVAIALGAVLASVAAHYITLWIRPESGGVWRVLFAPS